MLEALCKTCESNEPYEPSEWFNHIWLLYSLQRAGYPFEANDLTMEEWLDIGVIKEDMEVRKLGLING